MTQPQPSPALVSAFAPSGALRASINLGNPILASKDAAGGEPVGVSVDLAREFARRLGVGIELAVLGLNHAAHGHLEHRAAHSPPTPTSLPAVGNASSVP